MRTTCIRCGIVLRPDETDGFCGACLMAPAGAPLLTGRDSFTVAWREGADGGGIYASDGPTCMGCGATLVGTDADFCTGCWPVGEAPTGPAIIARDRWWAAGQRLAERARFERDLPHMRRVMAHPLTETEVDLGEVASAMVALRDVLPAIHIPRGPFMARPRPPWPDRSTQ